MRSVPLVGCVSRFILVLDDDSDGFVGFVARGNLLNVLHRVQGLGHAGPDRCRRRSRRRQPVDQLVSCGTGLKSNAVIIYLTFQYLNAVYWNHIFKYNHLFTN